MRNRTPTKVLPNGAIRYAVYDQEGSLLRYEYILPADEPTDEGTPLNKGTLLSDATAGMLELESTMLKNLVVNGSFERGDGGWGIDAGMSVGPMPDHGPAGQHGMKVLGGWPFGTVDQHLDAALNSGHVYYFRMLASTDGGLSGADVRITVGYMDDPGNSWDVLFYETGMDLSVSPMTAVSAICSNLSGDTLRIEISDYNPNYIDAVLFADLTETFGAGNEPDQAWCDENIPYFENSYAIEEPTVDEALRTMAAALAGSVRITVGSYTGAGTYGKSHPNRLAFDFEPYVVFVFMDSYYPSKIDGSSSLSVCSESFVCFLKGGRSVLVADTWTVTGGERPISRDMPYEMDSRSLSWYFDSSSEKIGPMSQLNISGAVYHYLAVGRGGGR